MSSDGALTHHPQRVEPLSPQRQIWALLPVWLPQGTLILHRLLLLPWCSDKLSCYSSFTFPFIIFLFFLSGGTQYDQNHLILNTVSKEKLTQVWEATVL